MLQAPLDGVRRALLLLKWLTKSCYNLVSVLMEGTNFVLIVFLCILGLRLSMPVAGATVCVDCLSLCLLVLVISFCVLGLGLMTFLDIEQTESTPLNILANHWRKKLVSSNKEEKVSYSLLLRTAHLHSRAATHRVLRLGGD